MKNHQIPPPREPLGTFSRIQCLEIHFGIGVLLINELLVINVHYQDCSTYFSLTHFKS